MRLVQILMFAAIVLAGCSVRAEPLARLGLRLAPAGLGMAISVQQRLTVERDGRVDELHAALEVDQDRLQLVGLVFGLRVLSLEYDGSRLASWRHFLLPPEVRPEDVLEDVQLCLWPADAIAAALPSGWAVAESGLERTLTLDGEVVARIGYSKLPRWAGVITLDNLRYKYRLTIEAATP